MNHNHEEFDYPPLFINKDCIRYKEDSVMQYDLIFTCPPYWNIEKYQSCIL